MGFIAAPSRTPPVNRILLLAVTIALAGCGDPGSGDPSMPSNSSTLTSTVTKPQVNASAPLISDTLHFLEPPAYAAVAPLAQDPIRVAIPSNTDNVASTATGAGGAPRWRIAFTDSLSRIEGNATLWVEVSGTVVGDPANPNCFWQLALLFELPNGQASSPTALCIGSESQVVSPGVRRLDFALDIEVAVPAGTNMTWSLSNRAVAMSPGSQMDLLTGSAEFDSQATIVGLALPIDPADLQFLVLSN